MENTIQTYWNQKFPSECNCTIDTIKTLDVKNNSSDNNNIPTYQKFEQTCDTTSFSFKILVAFLESLLPNQDEDESQVTSQAQAQAQAQAKALAEAQACKIIERINFVNHATREINNITSNTIVESITSNTKKIPSKDCNFESKILLKKALLFTNNNLGQKNKLLNIPFYRQWSNVANGKKVTGQPSKQFGLQNFSQVPPVSCPNQFTQNSKIVNRRILLSCNQSGLFSNSKNNCFI